jgi:hypothetical protein
MCNDQTRGYQDWQMLATITIVTVMGSSLQAGEVGDMGGMNRRQGKKLFVPKRKHVI